MKIYLDLILLLNFGFDLILLLSVAITLRRKTSLRKIFIASFLGSLTVLSLFIPMNSLTLFISKIIISILMVIISFGYKDIKYTLINLFYLYTSSILLGGCLYLININLSYKNIGLVFYHHGLSINIYILIFISPIIIYLYIKQNLSLKNNYNNYYNIDIYLKGGEIIKTTAFLDTGNILIDPYKKRPIILLNKELLTYSYHNINTILVPYNSLNHHGLLKCIIPEKVYIQGIGYRNNLLIGISDEKIKIDGIDCILNSKLIEREI